ncbi:MAG TPA: hypothetical protein VER55_09550 [Ardenticatenaceae bacterium]|nr:hypothetical protein [Ardenticatenaceae bacterium]
MNTISLEPWQLGWREKVRRVLSPGEPAWLLKEQLGDYLGEPLVFLTMVSRWEGGWTRRTYTYDPVGDVLHYRGETPVSSAERGKLKPEQLLQLRPQANEPSAP